MAQLALKKWRKRARRYGFISGIAGTLLFLSISFIKPHVITIIDWAVIPCVLYAVFLVYQYYQFKREFKGQLEE